MTPKEKAEQLVESFMLWKFQKCELTKKQAKQCALIAVDEILEFAYNYTDYNEKSTKEYWEEVKQEIFKL
jgi:hypothetical protein